MDGGAPPAEPGPPRTPRRPRRSPLHERGRQDPGAPRPGGAAPLRHRRLPRRVEALGPRPRPLRHARDRPRHPDAPLSRGGAGGHRRPAPLGDPDERHPLAALPHRRPVGRGRLLRGGPRGGARGNADALRADPRRGRRRSRAVRAVLPAGRLPPARRRLEERPRPRPRRRPFPRGAGRRRSLGGRVPRGVPVARPHHRRPGRRRPARRGAGRGAGSPLPAAVHPLRRGSRPPAGGRREVPGGRTPPPGAERHCGPARPRGGVLGEGHPLLARGRRSLPRH